MVSKASEDFPDPESPVKTISFSRGSSRETFFRLCSRAPRITSVSDTARRIAAGSAAPDVRGHPQVEAGKEPEAGDRALGEAGDRRRAVPPRVDRHQTEAVVPGGGHHIGSVLPQ